MKKIHQVLSGCIVALGAAALITGCPSAPSDAPEVAPENAISTPPPVQPKPAPVVPASADTDKAPLATGAAAPVQEPAPEDAAVPTQQEAGKPGVKNSAQAVAKKEKPKQTSSEGKLVQPQKIAVGHLVKPKKPTTTLMGCLADPEKKDSTAKGAQVRRGGDKVTVAKGKSGITVSHYLNHLCCLEASVKSAVTGTNITVEEQLSGTPCKCMCSSTIKTSVPLPLPMANKTYKVTVTLDDQGNKKIVHEQEIIF
ncbi:MAG: hypothetical protein QNJ97_02485 [Myxococcota bacterium]|nr:hypothetical protein [Myxococcota bacterium]